MKKQILSMVLAVAFLGTSLLAQKEQPPVGGSPKDFTVPAYKTLTLGNGMKVTLVPYGKTPKASVRMIVRTGSLNEPADQVWISDLAADMLLEGTKSRTGQAVAEEVASYGGELFANAGTDQSQLGADVLSEFTPALIKLLGDVLSNPRFDEKDFERIKGTYLTNLAVAQTTPDAIADKELYKLVYGTHPYGVTEPSAEALKSYTVDMARGYHEGNFGAKRAHLYVAGVFDEKAVIKAIEETFNGWKAGSDVLINPAKIENVKKFSLINRPGAKQSKIIYGIGTVDPSSPDYVQFTVMNSLLGGSFGSRITSNIRENKGYTYSPSSGVMTRYRSGFWYEEADVSSNVTGPALKEIQFEIKRLGDEVPAEAELQGIKNYEAGIFVLRNSSRAGILGQLGFINFHGLSDDYLKTYVKKVIETSPADVSALVKKYLPLDKFTLVIVGDKAVVEPQLKELGY
ncbi:MAG: peptidase M16 [Ignavibacteriaceae bacterium]|nr:MAG: insulinase family protein [Chlorobiota bacterium]GJQ32538.1 MAG: peptidase M16 [Ignavibacteriaceae bacterium]